MEDIRYEEETNEYYIDDVWVPTAMKFDARLVRPQNLNYTLQEVTWDIWNNKNIDKTGKTLEYNLELDGNQTIVANYKFVHRRVEDDIVYIQEFVYIEGIKKDAILKLDIEKPTDWDNRGKRCYQSRS